MESIELRNQRHASACSRIRGNTQRAVGQHNLADADRLGAGSLDRHPRQTLPHHRHLCLIVYWIVFWPQLDNRPPFLAEVAPITGPMYQLFIFFMITDPKTTVKPRWAQCLVAFLVAVVEMALRLAESVHAPYFALAIVGPIASIIEIAVTSRRKGDRSSDQLVNCSHRPG